jgi:type IV secretion system protein VirD4
VTNGRDSTPGVGLGLGPAEWAAAALLAVGALAGVGVWLVGALTGLVFGAGAPHLATRQVPGILAALPGHLADPRAAWPAGVRSQLPSAAFPFYLTGAAIALTAAGVVALVARAWLGRPSGARSARWARPADVRVLAVGHPVPGRVTLGRVGRRLVAAEPRHSVLALAPTQARKTSGLAIPAILEWDGPALVTSVKTDLVRRTLAYRQTIGDARVFDPVAVTGLPRAQWTPLGGCEDWHHAQRVAGRLAHAVQPGDQDNARFWSELGAVYLAPLLHAASRSFRTMSDVRDWVRQDNHPETFEEIHDALTGENPSLTDARSTYERIVEADERMRSSLAATAMVALKAYGDPLVVACSQSAEVTAEWLLSGPNTLYLCAPEDEQERLEPLFVTLVLEVVAAAYRHAAATGEPIDPPLLLLLDEVANVAAIPNLDRLASTAAGQGIQLVTIAQDLAQLRHRYGHDRARTIVNNHRARWIGAGTADPDTLDYVARLAGEQEIRQTSTSTTTGQPGRGQRTDSTAWRALAPQNVIREHAYGTGILIYGNLPPAQLTLRTWHDDPLLRHHASLPLDDLARATAAKDGRA